MSSKTVSLMSAGDWRIDRQQQPARAAAVAAAARVEVHIIRCGSRRRYWQFCLQSQRAIGTHLVLSAWQCLRDQQLDANIRGILSSAHIVQVSVRCVLIVTTSTVTSWWLVTQPCHPTFLQFCPHDEFALYAVEYSVMIRCESEASTVYRCPQ